MSEGRLLVNGSLSGGALVQGGAILGGNGTIAGPVVVETGGVLSPGNSPGTITVGSLTLQNDSQTYYELGTVSDLTVVNGSLQLDGSLVLSFAAGFLPTMGQSFTLFSGTFGAPMGQFDEVILPQGIAMSYDVNYAGGLISLSAITDAILAGDYNANGVVDAADYTVWRDNLGGPAGTLMNDPVGGDIGAAQYNAWRANFGAIWSPLGAIEAATVPEPSTLLLLLGGALVLSWRVWPGFSLASLVAASFRSSP